MTRMTDLIHNSKTVVAVKPQTVAAAGEVEGEIIDTQGFYALLFQLGSGADVAFSATSIQESDDAAMADAVDVPVTSIIGDATKKLEAEKAVNAINVIPNKRYVQIKLTTEGENAIVYGNATLFGADIDGEINAQ